MRVSHPQADGLQPLRLHRKVVPYAVLASGLPYGFDPRNLGSCRLVGLASDFGSNCVVKSSFRFSLYFAIRIACFRGPSGRCMFRLATPA